MKIDPFEAREFITTLLTRDVLRAKLEKLEDSIKKILPDVDIDVAKLLYYTTNVQSGRPLKSIFTDPAIGFKSLPVSDQQAIKDKIDSAYQLAAKIKDSVKEKDVERFLTELERAIASRKVELIAVSDKIVGTYDFDQNFNIVISNHPFDVTAKSSGQGWSGQSSEKIGDVYQRGIFSDVQNGSAVAFLVGKMNGHINARVMLRVCSGEREKGMGVEKKVYFDDGLKGQSADMGSTKMIAAGVRARDFHAYIVKILEEAKLTDYHTCTTPYIYSGYSDVADDSNTIIEYKRPKADTKNVDKKKTKGKDEKHFYK